MELLEVKYSRKIKRVTLQRFLVTKVVLETEKVKIPEEILVLYDNQLWLEKKCSSDPDFKKKFGSSLEVLSKILKEINFSRGLSLQTLRLVSQKFRNQLECFLIPLRNYQSTKSRFSGLFQLREAQQPGIPKKNLPPKRQIGIGYRDKGTLKDLAKDGSPSWQEVASRDGQLKLAIKRVNDAKTFDQLKGAFCDFFEINDN